MKKALITGITGQDGSYLTEFLLEKGYEVHGIKRRASSFNTSRIDHLYEDHHAENRQLILHYGDLTDYGSIVKVIARIRPDEIYNLGAQSHVHVSFEQPEYTAQVDGLGTLRILESIKELDLVDKTKFYQASTSELYGLVQEIPQSEQTPFYPRSPYGVAKLFAYWMVVNYRESYNIFASNGILFNHESPRRGETFVTRKITRSLSRIALGLEECLYMGNLDAKRDWGHAKEFVEAQWLILQQETAKDYVIATGNQISVRDFVELCINFLDIEIEWQGEGIEERAIIKESSSIYPNLSKGREIVKVSSNYFRPAEVETLLGDPSKALKDLGWSPKITAKDLVDDMMKSDLDEAKKLSLLKDHDYEFNKGFEI